MEIYFITTSYCSQIYLIITSYMKYRWLWWRIVDTGLYKSNLVGKSTYKTLRTAFALFDLFSMDYKDMSICIYLSPLLMSCIWILPLCEVARWPGAGPDLVVIKQPRHKLLGVCIFVLIFHVAAQPAHCSANTSPPPTQCQWQTKLNVYSLSIDYL